MRFVPRVHVLSPLLAHPAVARFPDGGAPIPSFQSFRSDLARVCTSALFFFWDLDRMVASAVLCTLTCLCFITEPIVWNRMEHFEEEMSFVRGFISETLNRNVRCPEQGPRDIVRCTLRDKRIFLLGYHVRPCPVRLDILTQIIST